MFVWKDGTTVAGFFFPVWHGIGWPQDVGVSIRATVR